MMKSVQSLSHSYCAKLRVLGSSDRLAFACTATLHLEFDLIQI